MAALATCTTLLAGLPARADNPNVVRQTEYGFVAGLDNTGQTGTYAWKGVPFAKPPVGELRWRAPQEPDAWPGQLATQRFGNACAQYGRLYGPGANNQYDATIGALLGQASGSEDCLYLNIWRPATAAAGLPVMVFVHGGSNITGYTADPLYDGAALARAANAVVVTVNYRLGIFGFLNQAQLKVGVPAEDASGNFALLDIIKSLRFINRNIASFGGDPGNVTLMGQSAGAVNVWALMTTPATVNAQPKLFHRLVPISGGLAIGTLSAFASQGSQLLIWRVIDDGLASNTAGANAWIAARSAQEIAAYLRSKTVAEVLATVVNRLTPLGIGGSGPIPEGTVLPTNPTNRIATGNYTRVPVMAGQTRDEGKLFQTSLSPSARLVTDAQAFDIAFSYQPNAAPQITINQWIAPSYLPVTTPVTGYNAKTAAYTQSVFVSGAVSLLNTLKTQQNEVWYYRFDWDKEPAPFNDIFGAAHGFDLYFSFGNFGPSLYSNFVNSTANLAGRLALSRAMMVSLGAFARTGDPNVASLGLAWPVFPAKMTFNATLTAKQLAVE
jgi:para-nitrobenzyl esterase